MAGTFGRAVVPHAEAANGPPSLVFKNDNVYIGREPCLLVHRLRGMVECMSASLELGVLAGLHPRDPSGMTELYGIKADHIVAVLLCRTTFASVIPD